MVFFVGFLLYLLFVWWWAVNHIFDFSEEGWRTRGCTLASSGFLCQRWLYCALLFSNLMVETHATKSMFLLCRDMFAQLLYVFPGMVIVDRSVVMMTNVRRNLHKEVLGPVRENGQHCVHIALFLALGSQNPASFWDEASIEGTGCNTHCNGRVMASHLRGNIVNCHFTYTSFYIQTQ